MIHHPPPKDSGGDPNELPAPAEVRHLTCTCQFDVDAPLSLCSLAVVMEHPRTVHDADLAASQAMWCVVCHDLARTALDVGRCQRCPT